MQHINTPHLVERTAFDVRLVFGLHIYQSLLSQAVVAPNLGALKLKLVWVQVQADGLAVGSPTAPSSSWGCAQPDPDHLL